jgi:hypothetical protein
MPEPAEYRREGTMPRIIIVSAACLLVTANIHAAELQKSSASNCYLKQRASLDLEIDPTSREIGVPVSVDGVNALMRLQIGNSLSLVFRGAANEFQLARRKLPEGVYVIDHGKRITESALLKNFYLGDAHYSKVELEVAEEPGGDKATRYKDLPLLGVLGLDVLSVGDFELNIAARKLILYSPDHCPGNVVYWTKNYSEIPYTVDPVGTIVFPMELDGKHLDAKFANTFALTLIDSNITRSVYGFDETSPGMEQADAAGDGRQATFRAMSITGVGLNISNAKVMLFKGNRACGKRKYRVNSVNTIGYESCQGVAPLTIGMDILSKLRIYVSTKEKILYLSNAEATLE